MRSEALDLRPAPRTIPFAAGSRNGPEACSIDRLVKDAGQEDFRHEISTRFSGCRVYLTTHFFGSPGSGGKQ